MEIATPTAEMPPAPFQVIPYPVRSFGNLKNARYRVYTSARDYVTVEAETATDALRMAKVTEPHRITRDIPGREVLLDRTRVLESSGENAAEMLAADTAVPVAPEEAAPPPAEG